MMIVLKHLSKDYNIEPLKLRQLLRDKFGLAKKRRWQWDDEVKSELAELRRIRQYLHKLPRGTKPSSR